MTPLLTEPTLTIDEHGVHEWRLNGVHHRLDGPARIWSKPADGEEWIVNGRYHRVGGPARILQGFGQYWYVDGHNITDNVEAWMAARDVTWPWDESTQVEFALTWC